MAPTDAKPAPRRRRRWLRRLAVWLVGIVVLGLLGWGVSYGLYIAEVHRSYRLAADLYGVEGGFWAFKERYDHTREEILGDEAQYWNDIYNRRFVNPRIAGHSLGFHTVAPDPLPAPGVTRVLCVGTSTVWEGFPDPLQRDLDRLAPEAFEIVDAGLPGASLTNLFMNYAYTWRQLASDVVIVEYNLDALPRHRVQPFAMHPEYDALIGPEFAADRILGFGPKLPWRRFAAAVGRHDGPSDDDLLGFRTQLEALLLMISGAGARPVLLTQQPSLSDGDARGAFSAERYEDFTAHYKAMFWSYELEGAMAAIDAQNDIIRELAAQHDLPLVDVVGTIPREDRYYTDATHLAPPGAAIVAQALLARMQEDGLVPPRD